MGSATITSMNPWIQRHVRYMQSAGLAETTIEDGREVLVRLDRELPLGLIEATIEELEHWLAGPDGADPKRPKWGRQTKATYYGHIVRFYRWAADPARMPHLSYDPSVSLTRPHVPRTVPRPVTHEDLVRVLAVVRGRFRIYCYLAAFAGLRACQIAALRREDVTEATITVRGKGGKEIIIPTHPLIWQSVEHMPAGPIARKPCGSKDSAKEVSDLTSKEINRRIGPNTISLHPMRHWFATWLLTPKEFGGAGASLRTVQELLGHSSPSTTAIYTAITDEQRRLAVNALPILAPVAI